MDIIKFLKERNRMCNYYDDYCYDCPLEEYNCNGKNDEELEAMVSAVERWSDEHPIKTIFDDFIKKHPNAPLDKNGLPEFCPHLLGYPSRNDCDLLDINNEEKCKGCWNGYLE